MGTHVPYWIYRVANSNVLFAGIPTLIAVVVRVGLRYVTRQAAGDAGSNWTDLDFGLEFVMAACVAIPIATVYRVGKEFHGHGGTAPRTTITIGAVILGSLVLLAIALARNTGRRRAQGIRATPSFADLVFGVFVPDLAGIFAVMFVLLFASRGGTLHP